MDRPKQQRGFSLIELMIAMLLGLILVAGLLTLFSATLDSSRDLTNTHQLDTQLHATIGLIVRDLRRAGSDADANADPDFSNPFALGQASAYAGEAAGSCLLFSYDINGNGVLDTAAPDERLGYRLKQGSVQTREGGKRCSDTGWQDVTTPGLVKITELRFDIDTTTTDGIEMHRIGVTLAGQLKRDATVHRSLARTVRVRNNARQP